uniref:Guanylate cyclase domain-containing protein n=1 Tax=Macrostomum lignano TaxID=282301 RepID=A0A1I8F5N9_9PLAT
VYNQTGASARAKDGSRAGVAATGLNDEGRVRQPESRWHRLVAQLTQVWQLQWVGGGRLGGGGTGHHAWPTGAAAPERPNARSGGLRTPFRRGAAAGQISSGALSSGRRAGHRGRSMPTRLPRWAITCEGIAMQALRSIKDVERDTEQLPCLTMELVMLPPRHLRRLQHLLELAAKAGESAASSSSSIACSWPSPAGFVPLLLPLLLFLMPRFRALTSPDYVRLRPSSISESSGERADGRCRAHEKRTGGSSEQDVALAGRAVGPEAAKAAGGGAAADWPRLSPLAELLHRLREVPHARERRTSASPCCCCPSCVMFQMGRAFSVGEIICYLTLLGFLVEEINEMITSAREETIKNYFFGRLRTSSTSPPSPAASPPSPCGSTTAQCTTRSSATGRWCCSPHLPGVTGSCACSTYRCVLESLGPKLKMMSLMVKKDFLPFLRCNYPEGKSIQSTGTEGRESASEIILGMFRNTFYAIVAGREYGDITGPNINDGDEARLRAPHCAVLVPTVYMVLYIVVMPDPAAQRHRRHVQQDHRRHRQRVQGHVASLRSSTLSRSSTPGRRCRRPSTSCRRLRNLASFVWRRLCAPLRRRLRRQRGQPAAAVCCRRGRGEFRQPPPGDTRATTARQVYLLSLYYQALAFRNAARPSTAWCWTRRTWTKATRSSSSSCERPSTERMERFDRIERDGQAAGVAGQGAQGHQPPRAPATSANKRASVLAMPYIEEGREEGPVVGRVLSTFLTALSPADKSTSRGRSVSRKRGQRLIMQNSRAQELCSLFGIQLTRERD